MFTSAAIVRAERSDDVRALSMMETCSSAYFGKSVLVKSIRLTIVPSIGVERTSTSTENVEGPQIVRKLLSKCAFCVNPKSFLQVLYQR